MKKIILSFIFVATLLFGCKKSETEERPTTETIYVVGVENNGSKDIAKLWKNGVGNNLSDGTNNAKATDIQVAGTDIYVSGWERVGTNRIAKYWKNGVSFNLTNGSSDCIATSIEVMGSDVYVTGTDFANSINRIVRLWKNGVLIPISTNKSYASDIRVFGTDVYLAGSGEISPGGNIGALYWKNGVLNSMQNNITIGPGFIGGSNGQKIEISNNDVYMCGGKTTDLNTVKAVLWKNSVLSFLNTNHNYSQATGMHINNNSVYIVGYERNPTTNIDIIRVWKDGVGANITNGNYDAEANSIFVLNNDVYICGYEDDGPNDWKAKYWKNGVATNLTNGQYYADATSIVIQ